MSGVPTGLTPLPRSTLICAPTPQALSGPVDASSSLVAAVTGVSSRPVPFALTGVTA
jgi:hypothetical protein